MTHSVMEESSYLCSSFWRALSEVIFSSYCSPQSFAHISFAARAAMQLYESYYRKASFKCNHLQIYCIQNGPQRPTEQLKLD